MAFIKSIKKFFNVSPEQTELEKAEALQKEQAAEQERSALRKRYLTQLKDGAEEEHLFEKIEEFINGSDSEYLSDALDVFQCDFADRKEEFWGRLCLSDDGTIAKVFIDKGILSHADEDGMPLVIAAREGNIKMAEFLLAQGADKNAWGGAPLVVSASARHMKFAEMLLEKGCDPAPLQVLSMYSDAATQVKCSTAREKIMSTIKGQFSAIKAERENAAKSQKWDIPFGPKAP